LNPELLHQETAHEPFVIERIRDDQDVGLQDCVGTERAISRNLIQLKADFRLKPYPLLIDESDDGDWSIADMSSQMSNFVEHLLAGCSQNSKATKTFETGAFVLWQGRLH
jgi:hypothetical protein